MLDEYIDKNIIANHLFEDEFIALYVNNHRKEKILFTVKGIFIVDAIDTDHTDLNFIHYRHIESFVSVSTMKNPSYDELKRKADSLLVKLKQGQMIRLFFDGTRGKHDNVRDPFSMLRLMRILMSRY